MPGGKGNQSTPKSSRPRARTAGGMALGCTGVLVLVSLVALPAQYLFSGSSAMTGTPTQVAARVPAQRRPTRTPRSTDQVTPIPVPSATPEGALVQVSSETSTPTTLPTVPPTLTLEPTATIAPTPEPTQTPTDTPMPSPTPLPTSSPTPTPLPIVLVTPLSGTAVINIRMGPGTGYGIVGQLRQGQSLTVTGVVEDASWWRVDFGGATAWVASRVATAIGDTQFVPVVPPSEIPRLPPRPPPATAAPPAEPAPAPSP